jgi:hypothetical protein
VDRKRRYVLEYRLVDLRVRRCRRSRSRLARALLLRCLCLLLLCAVLRLCLFRLHRPWVWLRALAGLALVSLLLLHLVLSVLSLSSYELLGVLEELLSRGGMLRGSRRMLLCHVPEVHHDLAVLLPLILGQTLEPEDVVGSHHLRLLAASRLLGLWLGLRITHCRGLERTSAIGSDKGSGCSEIEALGKTFEPARLCCKQRRLGSVGKCCGV